MNASSSILSIVQNYWFIILFVGGVVASWTRYEMKINDLESDTVKHHTENKAEIEKLQLGLSSLEKTQDSFREGIGKNIQEIQTTMKFILEAIKDIKDKK